ncbi:ABC transporter permease [Mesorhizobium zhangyense]|uniref:ABC transporter permease n=1 Tax=Mesorhizobium zhangyense TaxID=1776730 RepID=UPI001FE6F056|nr:ABC transporter permease [Mesorhizobium zhangyense]
MIVARLALQSLRNRWVTVLLTILAISVSVMLLLGVEKVRSGARDSFAGTVSGADVLIGARSGAMQLLLYSVFRIGNATNNVTWRSYQDIVSRSEVAWAIPLSLGDSHRGFRVIGTTPDYFGHFRYRGGQALTFAVGAPFDDLFDVVIGSDVASRLGYSTGEKITVAHGAGSLGPQHDDLPFRVSGILARTGTPVDKSLHVSLKAVEAIHVDWRSGSRIPGSGDAGRPSAADVASSEGDNGGHHRLEVAPASHRIPARCERVQGRASFGCAAGCRLAGDVGTGRHCRDRIAWRLSHGRGDFDARSVGDDPVDA